MVKRGVKLFGVMGLSAKSLAYEERKKINYKAFDQAGVLAAMTLKQVTGKE